MANDSTWRIRFRTPGGEQRAQLVLSTSGRVVTGTYDGAPIRDGQARENEISFKAELTSPFKMTVTFTATIIGDTMTGKAKSAMMTIPFTGTQAAP
jgi:hypothetical protein